MRHPKYYPRCWRKQTLSCALGFLLLAGTGRAQTQAPIQAQPRKDQESEVESRVSFSAATLTDILQHEPGLLLQVKKLLVRKAYEQGRLLDPEDLTDDALFRLLREDDNIRILATQEIVRREYVRAKPTRQEQDELAVERINNPEKSASPVETEKVPQSQEEKYWSQHEELSQRQRSMPSSNFPSEENSGTVSQPNVRPYNAQPPGGSPGPSSRPADDQRRQDLAGMQPRDQDSYDLPLSQGGSALTRVAPEDLPGLLSASMNDARGSGRSLEPDGLLPEGAARSGSAASSLRSYSPDTGLSRQDATSVSSLSMPDRWPSRNSKMPQADARVSSSVQPVDDHPVIRHRVNPYADVPSLYDLYAQVSKRAPVVARFGEDVFQNGTGNFDELPMDLPVGPDYVLGPGDGLSIELWGGVSQRLQRVVDREGRVTLPEAGAIPVTGRTLTSS